MIHRLEFSIDIQANKSTIWKALWDNHAYRQWAGVFFKGSYIVCSDWQEGNIIQFLGPDQNGIYSKIETHHPNDIIQFRHLGNVVNGEEQPIDEETKKWSGATEIYKLIEGDGSNTLHIEIDVMDEHLEFMKNTFPQALEKIKSNCA